MSDSDHPTILGPEVLRADLDAQPGLATARHYAYWFGLRADCPTDQIDVGGLSFVKSQELLRPKPGAEDEQIRVPVIGGMHKRVTEEMLLRLKQGLPRIVIRFRPQPEVREERGTGLNVGDVVQRARKGYAITIPTQEQVAAARRAKRPIPSYYRQPEDRPAADFMYFHFCDNQEDPKRGSEVPPTISEAGIYWPDPISEEELLLT